MSNTTQDTVVLTLGEDAYQGDAQFSVAVNGVQIATGQSVTASQADGVSQQYAYQGDFGPGSYNVTVTFLNDAYASPGQDRNLYVDNITVNGANPSLETVTNSSGQTSITSTPVELYSTGDTTTFSIACYLRGTRIAVPGGETAIEALRSGDLVLTASGQARPVAWVGHRRIAVAGAADPARVRPIRVKAGAVAAGVPARDLLVSPEHMLFLDGALIPARALVNGVTVQVADEIAAPHYFHVELESHDVLLAEGLPAESWLDAGNRGLFANAPVPTLRAELEATPASLACAPVVEDGPALDRARERRARRAIEAGQSVRSEVLVIEAPGTYRVAAPPGAAALRLVSPAPARHDADERRLGATVTAVAFDGKSVPLDDARLARGFHGVERHGGHAVRWTDGDALITFGAEVPGLVEIKVGSVAESLAT